MPEREHVPLVDASSARRALPRDDLPGHARDAIPAEEAFAALGVGRTIGFGLLSSGALSSDLVDGRRFVPIQALKRFRAERCPLAIISQTRIGNEAVRVAVVSGEHTNSVEVRVSKDGRAEAIQFAAAHLMRWRKHLSGQRLRDVAWHYGVLLSDADQPPARPKPCPGLLARSDVGGEFVTVQITETEFEGERRVEITLSLGAKIKRIAFSAQHLRGWVGDMRKAALVAWRAGALHDDAALMPF